MRSRGVRASFARAVLVGTVIASGLGLAHAGAPVASAACEGGWRYSDAISWAHAAVVGTIATIGRPQHGLTVATAVRVQEARGIATGSIVRGTFVAALCADSDAKPGARVLILFGIGATTEGATQPDFFWTIGGTVTRDQAANALLTVPNTATEDAPAVQGLQPAPWLLILPAGVSFVLSFRRLRRDGPTARVTRRRGVE